jgi:(p)ppGpp synthase/HD superfamily hydrolase
MILDAIKFAIDAHFGQYRDLSKEPYINHPKRVAGEVALLPYVNEPMIAAAWLHDVVEDCGVSLDTIHKHFGPEVASLVKDLTFDVTMFKNLSYIDRKMAQNMHVTRASFNAKSIKLIDRMDNLADLARNVREYNRHRLDNYLLATRDLIQRLNALSSEYVDHNLLHNLLILYTSIKGSNDV